MTASLRRLQAGRMGPCVDMGGGVGDARSLEQGIAFGARTQFIRFRLQGFGEQPETIVEGKRLLETKPPCHERAPFRQREAGAQPAFTSQVKATIRSVMG